MARPEFHELTVSSVRRLTDESVAVRFEVPVSLAPAYEFIPGQYLTLRTTINGEDVRRSYSICSGVGEALEVGIKQLQGGLFSTFAQNLAAGDTLQVMTPQGNFNAAIGGHHHYILISAGSGITPCLSIASSVLAMEPQSIVTLVYGNRTTSSIMFRQDVNDLKDFYTTRFVCINVLSREKQDAECLNGRIDGLKISALAEQKLLNLDHCDGVYICGPSAMVDDVKNALGSDVPVHTELFTTGDVLEVKTESRIAIDSDALAVRIIIDGAEREVMMNPQSETVLAAAQKAGLDLPFSCAGGMCCTCRCKVVSGKTAMDMNFSLAEWEVEAGFTLACQTRPLDNSVLLDFDEF